MSACFVDFNKFSRMKKKLKQETRLLYIVLNLNIILIFLGRVLIQCLKPIPTEGLTKDDVNKLTEDTRDVMMDVFTKNSIVTGAIKADKPANGVKTHNLAKSE